MKGIYNVREMDYVVIGRVPSKPYRYVRSYILRQKVIPRVTRIDAAQADVTIAVENLYAIQAGRKKGTLNDFEQKFLQNHIAPYSTNQFYADAVALFWGVEPPRVFAVAVEERLWHEADKLHQMLAVLPELTLTYIVQPDGIVKQV